MGRVKLNFKYVLAALFLLLGIPLAIYLIRIRLVTPNAAPTGSILSVIPKSTSVDPNTNDSFEVWIDPQGENVSSVQLIMTYDPDVITVTDVSPGEFFTSNAGTIGAPLEIIEDVSVPGEIKYAISFPLSANMYSSSDIAPVAIVSYTSHDTGVTNINFTTEGTIVSKVNNVSGNNTLIGTNPGTIAVGGGPTLYFSNLAPANPQPVSGEFTVDLLMDTDGNDVSGMDAISSFDPSILQITNIAEGNGSPFALYQDTSFDNTNGKFSISANIGTASDAVAVNGNNLSIATITFEVVGESPGTNISLDFVYGDRNDSNIVSYAAPGEGTADLLSVVGPATIISEVAQTATPSSSPTPTQTPTPTPSASTTPTPTPSPSPTPTPSPTATPIENLTIGLNFQGRDFSSVNKVENLDVAYRSPNSSVIDGKNVSVSANQEINFDLVLGDYLVEINAPGYLHKVFGTDVSPLHIVSGIKYLDMTDKPLLGGDFNGDNVVNEIDYSLYFIGQFGSSDNLTDLDGSGRVNNLDYGIMRANWGISGDSL